LKFQPHKNLRTAKAIDIVRFPGPNVQENQLTMKKITGLILIVIISGFNLTFSSSISKSPNPIEQLKYEKASEFIKLSFKEFVNLTGQKENLANRFSFAIMKMRIKHDLKKNPDLILGDYKSKHRLPLGFKIFIWTIVGVILIFALYVALSGIND
jgi:hypothetical protein